METPLAFGFEDGGTQTLLVCQDEYKKYKNRMGRGDGKAEASGGALGPVQVYRVRFHQLLRFLSFGKVIKTS